MKTRRGQSSAGTTASETSHTAAVLEVRDLRLRFRTEGGYVHAANGVNLEVFKGETLAIVGESGSGKTVTAQAIMGIVDCPPGEITGGQILYGGRDLLRLRRRERRDLQGPEIAMVFQDATAALNPRFTVGYQIGEMFRAHMGISWKESKKRAVELLDRVQIPSAAHRINDYPHQFSGGMNQRVMIAVSIALDPTVLIADEPTTALDVTIQAKIIQLLADLQTEIGMSLVLISHDLGVVGRVADRVAVMYAGRVVECGPVGSVYRRPAHPYTRALLQSVPDRSAKGGRLTLIPGSPPDLVKLPHGCPYHPRCNFRKPICEDIDPELEQVDSERGSACHFKEEILRAALDK